MKANRDPRNIRVFLCYRRGDGAQFAEWLYNLLDQQEFFDDEGTSCKLTLYYDVAAPGIADWKEYHLPSLESSKAFIFVSTYGASKDTSNNEDEDWVYRELNWWINNRDSAPIVIDTIAEDSRWLPEVIKDRWPDLNRIGLKQEQIEISDQAFSQRIQDRITGAIQESERRTVFEELEREKHLRASAERATQKAKSAIILMGAALALSVILIMTTGYFYFEADLHRQNAEAQSQISEARLLAAEARLMLQENGTDDLVMGSMLAMESLNMYHDIQADSVIRYSIRLFGQLVETFSPCNETLCNQVREILFDPDQNLVALTNSGAYSLREGSAALEEWERVISVEDAQIVKFSPDGKYLSISYWTGQVTLWNLETNQLSFEHNFEFDILDIDFHSENRQIAIAGENNTAFVLSTDTGLQLAELEHKSWIEAIAFSPDGSMVATASRDNNARIWNAHTGALLLTLEHNDDVNDLSFSPDGTTLATASSDYSARLWNVISGHNSHQLDHPNLVHSVEFSPDGSLLATASEDHSARIWAIDSSKNTELARLLHSNPVEDAIFERDGRYLMTRSRDQEIKLWDLQNTAEPLRYSHIDSVSDLSFSSNAKYLASTGPGSDPKVFDLTLMQMRDEIDLEYGTTSIQYIPPNGELLATVEDSRIFRWDSHSGTPIAQPIVLDSDVTALALSPNGKLLVIATNDSAMRILNFQEDPFVERFFPNETKVDAIAFSPDGTKIASASRDNLVQLWSVESMENLGSFSTKEAILTIEFSPDGKLLAAGGYEKTLRIWNIESGKKIHELKHEDILHDLAFAPSGKQIGIADASGTASIWDLDSQRILTRIRNDSGSSLNAIAFSPDGKFFATANSDGQVEIWHARVSDLLNMACHSIPHMYDFEHATYENMDELYKVVCPPNVIRNGVE